ncbi:adapter-related protein complex 3, beta subunit [Schistosoma mansoni]|uniref:adapter-related protein complex 3, beta subunit n=1 Tax=Schistosoma mansoni TaxID=6183 RepID=UPI00022DBEAD|nr:adapter-related protein complex 3, beta subunit [Schistosoma mansoni]|eukprot:XP_018653568.1 adapter-related protein complex 3, beta subunit [Schistosoma mansoni]
MLDEGFQSASLSSEISQGSSYNRSGDIEIGNDLSSSVVFSADFHKFDDLKNLLDTNKDAVKLGAMKRIIEMVARGKDCSDLFLAVVKNVVSKNAEIRKLVYAFLTHYAEQEQDIALLSISTFQRALKDPNQLVRASSLRVLSSIRIPLILPIVTLAIQEASKDLSPYVRKTAAHAILKVYSLDPTEKNTLIEIIDRLLSDKTTVVVGSAVRAFEEVCPERLDLIHKNYRKLCNLVMDVDEWGQVVILSMLTRYARTQFPNPENNSHNCTSSKSDTIITTPEKSTQYSMSDALPILDADRNALLNASRYLLHSHNSAVVMASSQLLFYLNAKDDYPAVVRALIRTLHRNREVQYIVLSNIASLVTIQHRHLFEPYLRSFFIFSTDSLQVKLLKLEILSSLITETSSSVILREFQYYVNSFDEEFVTATIQAIGRCASIVPQISDVCLGGLLRLMSRPKEKIMGECVIVLRKLLQMKTTDHKEIITHIAQLADTMTIPTALASILWLLGEFSHRVPKIAPDILRKMAKSFTQQETIVKFQIINLAAKLCIVNPRQTLVLTQYIFNLAKYDTNYDIRDKARFLRGLLFPQIITNPTLISDDSSSSPGATKPAPIIKSQFEGRSNFRLGTLSHILQHRLSGYRELTDWPTIPPDPWSRVIATPPQSTATSNDSEPSEMNSPKSSVLHTQHRIDEKKKDRFGNISLNDFFSETDDDDEEEEEEKNEKEMDELIDERQEGNKKAKRTLSSFYGSENTSSDGDDNGEYTSDEDQFEKNEEAIYKDDDYDNESDSDFDIEYLLRSKQQLSTVQNHNNKEQSSSSSNLSESQSSSLLPTGVPAPATITTLNDTITSESLKEDSFTGEKFIHDINELQTSMKQDLNSWLNAQSSSSSSNVSVYDAVIEEDIEKLIEQSLVNTSDSKPSCDQPSTNFTSDGAIHTQSNFKDTSEVSNKETNDSSNILYPSLQHSNDDCCVNSPVQIHNYSLLWFTLTNPHQNDIIGELQYTRIVWPNHPKLIVINLKLSNQNTSVDITNIQFDLMNSVIGRLLVDANRIQSFSPIVQLKPQSTCTVQFGIDFAGFCDPIDLDLIYQMKSNDSLNTNNNNHQLLHRWRICLNPPASELIRPIILNEKEYFNERSKLISTQSFYHNHLVTIYNNEEICQSELLSKLITHLLQHINIQYQFHKIQTNPKSILCLLELSYWLNNLSKNDQFSMNFSLFCNSSTIFRNHLSLYIEKVISTF